MDLPMLNELHEAEVDSAERIISEITSRHDETAASALFPELSLISPYTYCIGSVRPVDLLPFFRTVIVDLRPLPSPAAFEVRYGLTVPQFVRLANEGRLAVRLRHHHTSFASLDYLDDLFWELPLPRSDRYKLLHRRELADNQDHARQIFANTRPISTHWMREYADWHSPPDFLSILASKFALVATYCGRSHAEYIVEEALRRTNDVGHCYDWLHIFSRFRVYPYMNTLDGINVLPSRETEMLPAELRPPSGSFLPYEIGRALVCNIPIEISRAEPGTGIAEPELWLRLLEEIDHALDSSDPGLVSNRATRLQILVHDTRRQVAKMSRRKDALDQRFVFLSGIGIAGSLSEYAPQQWKPIIAVGSATIFQSRSKIADIIVKFRKKSHVIAWFELSQELGAAGRRSAP